MARFAYRAVQADGAAASGVAEAPDVRQAAADLRSRGIMPVELRLVTSAAPAAAAAGRKDKAAGTAIIAELAVLLDAHLPLDRALGLALVNMEDRGAAERFAGMLEAVRSGSSLSRAMAAYPGVFEPSAIAMTEAGEANGALADALAKLAAMLERAASLRRTVANALIYPTALVVLAVGVIAMMLLFVVPQFESLFATSKGNLPAASLVVMGASRVLRDYWWALIAGIAIMALGLRQVLSSDAGRTRRDRIVLAMPLLGELVRRLETARFARTFGALVAGEVPVPAALGIAQRTIVNRPMATAVATVAEGVRVGGGLAQPLAAAGVLPAVAVGFLRTGEESSQLGMMALRLADMLDRDVEQRIARLIGILTPLITVLLGGAVGAIIASIMSAILGFNELAISS